MKSRWPVSVLSGTALAFVLLRALLTPDLYWDTLAYHWPYAARAVGLCDRGCFLLPAGLEARYDGFPLLWHWLQGLIWRVTGTPAAADVLNIGIIGALCGYLRWRFSVPWAWSWLAFLAVPEIQIQLTSSYIDVPGNAAITIALLVVVRLLMQPTTNQRTDVIVALTCLGIAANSKFQMAPVAVLTWVAVTVLACRNPSLVGLRRSIAGVVLALAGIAALVPKLALNAVHFGNPFYPIAAVFGPLHLPGPEAMAQGTSISDVWLNMPHAMRWLASVVEFDAFRGRPLPWTLGNGDVLESNPSFRMGGYFVGYVLGALTLLATTARTASWPLVIMFGLSVLCAFLPASHELRYYMFWMMTLVALMLALVHSPLFATTTQASHRRFIHALIVISFLTVTLMTGGAYFRLGGPKLEELVNDTMPVVAAVNDGETLCVLKKDRRAFLYAPVFHPGRHHRTVLLENNEPNNECTKWVDLK